jgi:hypothetical protein
MPVLSHCRKLPSQNEELSEQQIIYLLLSLLRVFGFD